MEHIFLWPGECAWNHFCIEPTYHKEASFLISLLSFLFQHLNFYSLTIRLGSLWLITYLSNSIKVNSILTSNNPLFIFQISQDVIRSCYDCMLLYIILRLIKHSFIMLCDFYNSVFGFLVINFYHVFRLMFLRFNDFVMQWWTFFHVCLWYGT